MTVANDTLFHQFFDKLAILSLDRQSVDRQPFRIAFTLPINPPEEKKHSPGWLYQTLVVKTFKPTMTTADGLTILKRQTETCTDADTEQMLVRVTTDQRSDCPH